MLFSELLLVVHWFNPLMWLFSYELKLQHELAADAWVMKKGYNAGEYKQQLIRSTLGFELLPALNNFNKSFIKKRIRNNFV